MAGRVLRRASLPAALLVLAAGLAAALLTAPAGPGTGTANPVRLPGARPSQASTPARSKRGAAGSSKLVSGPLGQPCPWAAQGALRHASPSELAAEVVSHMTVADELAIVDLRGVPGYENATRPLRALCIPRITLQDGPDGLTNSDTGVTQLPSALAVAATFDTAYAYADGAVEGEEAHAQGIDVVQAPMLNIDRVPEDGRAYETYGEDPTLVSGMGVADIEGIQSKGVMAQAKHLTGYTQEGDRHGLDQIISMRQLEEIYLAPFAAAVEQAHVASIMCAYGKIDGTTTCADPLLYEALSSWGFQGFVRSDMSAVVKPAPAFAAGMDAVKPAMSGRLAEAIANGWLSRARLASAAERILTEMFRFDLVARPLSGHTDTPVDPPAHAAVALRTAEASAVLLKNTYLTGDAAGRSGGATGGRGGGDSDRRGRGSWALPIDFARVSSVAVIGSDAAAGAMSAGWGGARVLAPFLDEPVTAIGSLLRHATLQHPATLQHRPTLQHPAVLRYADGGEGGATKDGISGTIPIPGIDLLSAGSPQRTGSRSAALVSDATVLPRNPARGAGGISTAVIPTADRSGLYRSTMTLVPPATGLYDLSLEDDSAAWMLLDGRLLFDLPERHELSTWTSSAFLRAGRRYELEVLWRQVPTGPVPVLGWRDVSPEIEQAVRAARASQVAIVFASDYSSEGVDRPDLDLPGDQNELISAVAAANPDTIVVLNTAGPVLMPWLDHVAGVIEAWYPGEENGTAIAAVLSGQVDPSGRLPVTFPAGGDDGPAGDLASFPGINGVVDFSEGLDVGYRWYEAHHVRPLFPFGYGLDYTSFRLSGLTVSSGRSGVRLDLEVTNTGHRAGAEVVQAYVGYPAAAGEPPWQLRAFERVELAAGANAQVSMLLPPDGFRCWLGRWETVPGRYELRVGTSSQDLELRGSIELGSL